MGPSGSRHPVPPFSPPFFTPFSPPSAAAHPLGGLQVCNPPEGAHNSWGSCSFSPQWRHSSLFGRLFPVISSRHTSSFNPSLALLLLIQDRDLRPSRSDISNPKNNIFLVNRGISLSLSLSKFLGSGCTNPSSSEKGKKNPTTLVKIIYEG